eukprot:CAMPEP_0197288664 /NCGR_PEP_ID=MMETSP0890-20130614/5821_1 /TAXON_ID=44058 ORGANISM="Aureoumbra lagunensis, Strain CCMP1510" /NCGR_SAMPLE_ID=MMETSP0890 /ASSEMBLY_ACC=CAM_ASM_000533 /LENGTH=259 /DNA_ID=CAMNT_0042759571 /DNA_START=371 /DNA_END=1147 /DNA_ORIENTATION=-
MSEYVLNTPPPEHMKEKNAPEKCGHPGTPVRDLEDREQFSEAVTPARQLLGRPSPPPPPPPTPLLPPADDGMTAEERESLRLAMELESEEEQYFEEQRRGAERLAELERARAASKGTRDEDNEDDEDDDYEEENDEEEIDESLALAWRLQQEEDDRALFMVLNGGSDIPSDVVPRNVSPSQMTYDQLNDLGERLGKVSKGTTRDVIDALPTFAYSDASSHPHVVLGEQCSICRLEFESEDNLTVLPCNHADHTDCLAQW